MSENIYASVEQAQAAFDRVPSYIQRYQDDPYLYSREETEHANVERFKITVERDGEQVDFREKSFCFDCQSWFVGEQHECSGKRRVA